MSYNLHSQPENVVLLLSCLSDNETDIVVGLLKENDIEVFVQTKEGVPPQYDIFIFNSDLPIAKELLANSGRGFIDSEDRTQSVSGIRSRLALRILLLANSLFFGFISYYAFVAHEKLMGFILFGTSVFFLLTFIFSFDWRAPKTKAKAQPLTAGSHKEFRAAPK
jgi:hypothetical protein